MKSAITLFLAAIFLWSCQKDASLETGNETGGVKKFISKHTHRIDKKIWESEFSYDQQDRCTVITSTYTDLSASYTRTVFTRFHYNGNEALPYKITDTSEGRDTNWYLFYDGQQRVIRDSVVYLRNGALSITRYAYNGNRLVANSIYTGPSRTETTMDTLESDGTNYIRRSSNSPATNFAYQIKTTYDNNPGAFNHVNVAPILMEGATEMGNYYQRSKNNPVTAEYTSPTSSTIFSYTITYAYDSDGYPVSSRWTIPIGTEEETEKFEYRK